MRWQPCVYWESLGFVPLTLPLAPASARDFAYGILAIYATETDVKTRGEAIPLHWSWRQRARHAHDFRQGFWAWLEDEP